MPIKMTSISQIPNGTLRRLTIYTLTIIMTANSTSATAYIFLKYSCFPFVLVSLQFLYFLESRPVTISLIAQKISRKNIVINAIKRISLTTIPPFSSCKIIYVNARKSQRKIEIDMLTLYFMLTYFCGFVKIT